MDTHARHEVNSLFLTNGLATAHDLKSDGQKTVAFLLY